MDAVVLRGSLASFVLLVALTWATKGTCIFYGSGGR